MKVMICRIVLMTACLLFNSVSIAGSQDYTYFNVISSGKPIGPIDIELCLRVNVDNPCKKYTISGSSVSVTPVYSSYNKAGVKLISQGYIVSGCTIDTKNGFCEFELNYMEPYNLTINSIDDNILSANVKELALSVKCPANSSCSIKNASLTGHPRQIIIKNSSRTRTVTGLNSILVNEFPEGTSITRNTCTNTIAPGDSCIITITPGTNAGYPCARTKFFNSSPSTVQISTDNTVPLSIPVYILTYGCFYQGGYIFSVDDTTPPTTSIGGRVINMSDLPSTFSNGVAWSSDEHDPNGIISYGVPYDSIYGIDTHSTTTLPIPSEGKVIGQKACKGNTDGSCNTNNIYVYYQYFSKNHPIAYSRYAAGLCKENILGYSDWYLPAICEMGYDTTNTGSLCGSSASPIMQNIQSNLIDNSVLIYDDTLLYGNFWSSTQLSSGSVWIQHFSIPQRHHYPPAQYDISKDNFNKVRCVRALSEV